MVTDRGPLRRWLWVIDIGRTQEPACDCMEIQNAVHMRRCKLVGDGRGRSMEEAMEDEEWCKEVVNALTR